MTDDKATAEPQAQSQSQSESPAPSVITQETAVVVPATITKPLNIPPPTDIGGLEKKGL
jgi:hypothetical protein